MATKTQSSTSNGTAKSSNGQASKKTSSSNGKQKSLRDLFEEGLKDIYNAEQQLIEALPQMAQAAYHEELQDSFTIHLEQTKKQAERLEKIFMRLRMDREGETCKAMEGLIEEGQKIIEEFEPGPVRDSALIIGAQKIEHYEIAAYGSLNELAEVLGYHKIADVLDRSLLEEEDTDALLTEIAQEVNDEALEMSNEFSTEEVEA
jgi:ferritin-like metal-binding protein YciE